MPVKPSSSALQIGVEPSEARSKPSTGLPSRTVIARSAVWRFLEVGGAEALAFAFTVLLARVLSPHDYGIVAMTTFFIASCRTVLSKGIPDAVVQSGNTSTTYLDTAFWINTVLGCVLSLVVFLLAEPSAALLGEPELRGALIGLSPLPVLLSAMSVYHAHWRRAMQFKKIALRTTFCTLIGGIVGTALAFSGAGYWSLIGQQLTSHVATLAILIIGSHWRPRLRLDRAYLRHFFRVGSQVSAIALLETMSQNIVPLIIGIFLPASQVGLFALARRICFSLTYLTTASINEIALPVLSKASAYPEKHRETVYKALKLTALLCVPLFASVMLFAEPLVRLLFGDGWIGSAHVLQFLLLYGILYALPSLSNQVFLSVGRPESAMPISIAISALLVSCVAILAPYGITSTAAAFVITYLVAAPLALARLRTVVKLDLVRVAREQAVVWIGVALMAVAVLAVRNILPVDFPATAQLPVEACMCAFALLIIVLIMMPNAPKRLSGLFAKETHAP